MGKYWRRKVAKLSLSTDQRTAEQKFADELSEIEELLAKNEKLRKKYKKYKSKSKKLAKENQKLRKKYHNLTD